MDATCSMTSLLNAAKDVVGMMFDRAYDILIESGHDFVDQLFEMQFGVYRNYNAYDVLQYSPFTNKPLELKKFYEWY